MDTALIALSGVSIWAIGFLLGWLSYTGRR